MNDERPADCPQAGAGREKGPWDVPPAPREIIEAPAWFHGSLPIVIVPILKPFAALLGLLTGRQVGIWCWNCSTGRFALIKLFGRAGQW